MKNRNLIKNIDFGLILIILALFTIGLLAIASATRVLEDGMSREIWVQSIAFIIGIFIVFIMLLMDYNEVGNFYKVVYILSIGVLLLVYVPGLGIVRGNAQSWIDLRFIDLQTSEIAKIGFIVSFAKFLDINKDEINHPKNLLLSLLFVSPFIILIYKQPDFGSMLVFVIIAAGMLLVAKLDWRYIGLGVGIGIVGAMNASKFLSQTQMERIFAFLEPDNLSLPGNYHVMASKTTIGAGMMTGRGIFQGVYHKGDWLPVQETDFIFAVWVEETGFIGGAIVIGLYLLLILNLMKMAYKSKDLYGALIISGVVFMFLFQIFENIGMTVGLMPVTGITLPFLSYGGSSMITNMMMIGLALNVYMRRKKPGMFSNM